MTVFERFESKFIKTDSCWRWVSTIAPNGYGMFSLDGRPMGAHRVAHLLYKGPIPENRVIDHLCRVRHCVNPDHLEIVTTRENTLRGVGFAAQNAIKTHCKKGHEYTPENTIRYSGRRDCRECHRLKNKRQNAKYRAEMKSLGIGASMQNYQKLKEARL